jgi:protein phosphatase 2C family protein 2/3
MDEQDREDHKSRVHSILHNAFVCADSALLQMCADRGGLDYASSTGVCVMLWPNNNLSIAHVGDSRASLGRIVRQSTAANGTVEVLHGEWLTTDHKPDQPLELERIRGAGGSLVYLHGNKPFIRGGDFLHRQAMGQHPKQLNYSRAFGGKDLKQYGLSAHPSISHRKLIPFEDRYVYILLLVVVILIPLVD